VLYTQAVYVPEWVMVVFESDVSLTLAWCGKNPPLVVVRVIDNILIKNKN
jgi:hypothetical protein